MRKSTNTMLSLLSLVLFASASMAEEPVKNSGPAVSAGKEAAAPTPTMEKEASGTAVVESKPEVKVSKKGEKSRHSKKERKEQKAEKTQ